MAEKISGIVHSTGAERRRVDKERGHHLYEVSVKVIGVRGTCAQGHKPGQEWVVGNKTPEGICLSSFNAMLSKLQALKYGAVIPGGEDADSGRCSCPDWWNSVVWELRRLQPPSSR